MSLFREGIIQQLQYYLYGTVWFLLKLQNMLNIDFVREMFPSLLIKNHESICRNFSSFLPCHRYGVQTWGASYHRAIRCFFFLVINRTKMRNPKVLNLTRISVSIRMREYLKRTKRLAWLSRKLQRVWQFFRKKQMCYKYESWTYLHTYFQISIK